METIRVTKDFSFEMAHALMNYDGKCAYIHGHSYQLQVTVSGIPITDPGNPKLGMVVDFSDLKRIVKRLIVDKLDHALVLHEQDPRASSFLASENLLLVPFQPTCENMLLDMVKKLKPALKDFAPLHSAILHETATSRASWFAADNENS